MTTYAAPWTSAPIYGPRILVTITISYPSGATLRFSDAAVFDSTINADGASVGMASAAYIGQMDLSGNDSVAIVLRNLRYIGDSDGSDEWATDYPDLVSLFTHYVVHGASVSVKQYAHDDATSDSRVILTGRVANYTDLTPSTVTVHISPTYSEDLTSCPDKTVGGRGWTVGTEKAANVPETSKGLAVPFRLGDEVYYPELTAPAGMTRADAYALIPVLKYSAGLIPARLAYDRSKNVPPPTNQSEMLTWGSQERVAADVASYSASAYDMKAYAYIPELDTLAPFTTQGANYSESPAARGLYEFTTYRSKHLLAYVVPSELSDIPGTSTNQQWVKAIDGKFDMFLSLIGGGYVRYKLPIIGDLGTITTCQLYVFTNNQNGATGTFYVELLNPVTNAVFSNFGTVHSLDATFHGWQPVVTTDPVPYPRSDTWRGTQWQRWQFCGSSTNESTDWDKYLWLGDGNGGQPFTLQIRAAAGANKVNVVAVAMVCGFIQNVDSFREAKVQYTKHKSSGWAGFFGATHRGERKVYDGDTAITGVHMWGRGNRVDGDPEDKSTPDPEGVYLWTPGFSDTSDHYGTENGVQGWIKDPGSILQYVRANYTHPQALFTIGASESTFGSVKRFNASCRSWVDSWCGSAPHNYDFVVTSQAKTIAQMNALMAQIPGRPMFGVLADGTRSLVNHASDPANDYAALHECVTYGGLSPHRDILRDENNVPRFEVQFTSVDDVVNDVEVHYQYDIVRKKYHAIARCNAADSNDGINNDSGWPTAPGSGGLSIEDICTLSETLYGPKKKLVIQANAINHPELAVSLAASKVWLGYRPQAMVRFIGTMACQDILVGQLISFHDDLYTYGGIACPKSLNGVTNWSDFGFWYVIGAKRLDDGNTVSYEITAIEHLNNSVGLATLSGGPALTPGAEGFDQ